MRFVLICLAAVLLSGCGYIAGKRVDFASDYSKYPNRDIQALAGKTFYISNNDDYERLILLKKDLRELYNSPTPTRFLQASCVRDILQITDQYESGILGFIFTGKVPSKIIMTICWIISGYCLLGLIFSLWEIWRDWRDRR